MKRHANLSVFVPHAGCTHRCSFCDQHTIAGTVKMPTPEEVAALCEAQLPAPGEGEHCEIAFFGGSFTALDEEVMCGLLAAAAPFVEQRRAAGIRLSTRPDAIDPAKLALLHRYHVTAVELGAQSMSDKVLALNERGHTSLQVRFAARLIKNAGFSLGLQMMVGLYGETDPVRSARDTALALAALEPDTVRIYPALVLPGTGLARLYAAGAYKPLTVEAAVEAVAPLLELFEAKGIRVIRVGLHDEPGLAEKVLAGPYHPAFRQLCDGALYLKECRRLLAAKPAGRYILYTAPGQRSAAAGQKNQNLAQLAAEGWQLTVCETQDLSGRAVCIAAEN